MFFKGRDADALTQAFKGFVKVNEKKQNRSRVSVRENLAHFKEIVAKNKSRERAGKHQKDRGYLL